MGVLADRLAKASKDASREQAIVDRNLSEAGAGSVAKRAARGKAEIEIDQRRAQRAYAEQAPPEIAEPVREMLANKTDRKKVLDIARKMTPEQRQEALRVAPGIAQQLGDDRGGALSRTGQAIGTGISAVSQPLMELVGAGGTREEIDFIHQLESASGEFSAARPDDPWYVRGPLQVAEMAPWVVTVAGGGGLGRAALTQAAKPLAGRMIASTGARTLAVAGKLGELGGITAAAFPSGYSQEVDQLKAIGMEDGTKLRMLAGTTAAITGLIEGIVPNPFKVGPVSLTQGATKAARQYLWNAAKQAPAEITEEYLQGVTSGAGQVVANYLDENTEDKTMGDAFRMGWEQAKEAALPMSFLLGVPAVAGAGVSSVRAKRLAKLQEMRSKGFISEEEAKKEGIEGKNRKERLANADKQIEDLQSPWNDKFLEEQNARIAEKESLSRKAGRAIGNLLGTRPQDAQPPSVPAIPPQGGTPSLPGTPTATTTPPALPGPQGGTTVQPPGLPGPTGGTQPPSVPPSTPAPASPTSETQGQVPQPPGQSTQPKQPAGDVVEGTGQGPFDVKGKLYREDPSITKPSERLKARQEIDPAEGTVLVTKDAWGKPIAPETLAARQEFIDNAKPGAEFDIKGFETSGPYKVMDDGKLLDTKSGRVMGDLQSRANQINPGDITWKTPIQAKETAPASVPQQPKGGGPATTKAEQVPASTQQNAKEIRQGKVGDMMSAGEVATTSSGRKTTPFPTIDVTSDRKASNTIKRADKWLWENAVEEAKSRGDDFNLTQFKGEDPTKLPQASKDAMEEYLFGEQPKVVPPITKSLVTTAKQESVKDWETGRRYAARNALSRIFGESPALSKVEGRNATMDEIVPEIDKAESKSRSSRVDDGINWSDVRAYAEFQFGNPQSNQSDKQQSKAPASIPTTKSAVGIALRDRVVAKVQAAYDTKNYSEDGLLSTIKRSVDSEFGKLTTEIAGSEQLTNDVREWINEFDANKFTGAVRAYLGRKESAKSGNSSARPSESSEETGKPGTQPEGVGSSAPKKGAAQPATSGWKSFKPDISITESPDLKRETSRRQKKDPGFPLDAGSPVTVYRRNNGKDEMQEGIVEDFADSMPANIKVRLNDGTLVTPLVADVGPAQTKPAAKSQDELDEDQLPPSAIKHMMQGDRLKGVMWRSPTIGGKQGEYGAFYATNEEGAGKYSRGTGVNVVVSEMVELNNPLVVDTKQQAMDELRIDESSLSEPSDTQDIHHFIDIAIFEAATKEGYDGVVYKDEGYQGNPIEVHVFNPPDVGELPAFTVQGKRSDKSRKANSESSPADEQAPAGSLSIDDFAEIFANPETPTKPAKRTGKKLPEGFKLVAPGQIPSSLEGMRGVKPPDVWMVVAPSGATVGSGSTADEALSSAAQDEEHGDKFGGKSKRPGKKRTGKKDPKEGIKEGLDEAKAGADLILKGLKDLGSNLFSGPPINADIARGMGMMANGLIKAGKYKFVEFIDQAVEMLGAPTVKYLGPYLEAGWNKKAETDSRLDKATSVSAYLSEPEALYTVEGEEGMIARVFKHKDGFSVNVTDTDSGLSGDQVRIFPELKKAKAYADTIKSPQSQTKSEAQSRIAERVRDALEQGTELDSKTFFAIADEEFGGKRSNNDYGDSQATDALELGVNLYLQGKTDPNVSVEEAIATLDRIQEVMKLVPRHRGRTGNKDLMQQFSTPPAYAYAVNWIANVTGDDVVVEPSAGMGGIAIHAANAGATVYANELDPARANGLRELPLEKVFTEDAEQIGAILAGKMSGLSVVLMNPPFSRAGMRMGDRMVQGTDRKHIDEALTLLPDGGRLVAIVGAGLHGQGQKMTKWLDDLPYQLAANIEVARDVYRGYGTEFPTRVLVIDKVPRTGSALVRSVGNLAELIETAEEVRNARPRIQQDENQSGSVQGATEDGQRTGSKNDVRDTTGPGISSTANTGTGQTDNGQRGNDRGDRPGTGNASSGSAGGNAGSRGGRSSSRGKAGQSGRSGSRAKAKSGGNATSGKPKNSSRGSTDRSGGLTKVKATSQKRPPSAKTELGESTFEVYVPSVVVEGAKPHPAPIVESAAMAAVDAPKVDYEVDLMPGVFEGYVNEDGAYVGISDIQLEAIAMAGAAHEQMLPNGERRGFLIGDGTGVGKAREALGIIMDDLIKRGTGDRRKAVFITKNDGLVKDAVNEWVGVGGDPSEMRQLSNIASGEKVNYESGVLTLSYDTLKGEASVQARAQGNELSRVDQIIDWVGEDFDGVIVFDEAHLMANSLDTGTGNQTKGASKRALSGVDLQQRLPNARFVYLSATAATEVRNLAYAERLGLWGPGTSFDSKHRFINDIESGGVAAMEKVAADMKAMGMYVARNLSFDDGTPNGRVEFDRILHKLSDDQRRVYDKLSEAWLKVLGDIDSALDITNNARGKSRILSAFWSANQRFWNDVVTTMMAPTLIQNIERDLKENKSVVIQLSTTKEAATSRAIAGMKEGQTYDEIDASPRRALMEYVERAFPTQRHETYIDDAGNERTRPVVDSEGNPVHDPAAVAMKERLLDEIGSLDVASRGPIDMIIDHFGSDMVAEISGRSQRLVKGDDGRLELEKRGKAAARADRDSFMDGQKRVLLFSEAGGTGASYHASLSVANQQRRSHYLWQPGWSAPVAVQGLGRAHRSNQASAPLLHLLEPNLEGYKRFISTIARRLGQLGALTKGQRTAADAGLFGASDNLESTEANRALFQFINDAVGGNIEGIDREFLIQRLGLEQLAGDQAPTPEMFTITQFLNRMLNLPLAEQNRVFSEFQSRMDNLVAQAIQDGTLDQGMETLKAEKIVKANETIVNEHSTGAKTKLVELTLTTKIKPTSFESMLHQTAGSEQYSLHGFVKSNTTGKVFAVVDQNRTSQDSHGNTLHDAMFIGVEGNSYGHSLEQIENAQHWQTLNREQARETWDKQFAAAPTTRESTTYLLTGALLPVWSKIPGSQTRVVRALTTEGETILGRVIPERLLQRTIDSLGVASDIGQKQYTPKEAIQIVYQGGTIELANGWKIKKRTIDGEENIEIIGPDYSSTDGIVNAGGFKRRIDYTTRFFIPFDDTEGEILGEITRISPIASVTAAPRGSGGPALMKSPTEQTVTRRPRDPAKTENPIAAADIQKTAERLFDVAIRQNGFSQRAAGIYKWMTGRKGNPSPEVVRTGEAYYANLAVIAHEIAHHIDETTKAVDSMPKGVKAEVSALDYEPKSRPFEGFAEFLRRYMTEPPIDVAGNMIPNPGIDAPATLAWFESTFLPAHGDIAKAIAEFRSYAQQFANQSVFARIGSMIADRKPQDLRFAERWKQKSKRWVNRLKTAFLDKFHTLEWIQKEAREKGYTGIGIYDMTMAYFMSATSHATIAFEEGARSLRTGKKIGQTKLWELSRHLQNDQEYDEAVRYALARHTLYMDRVKPGYNTGVSVEDAEAWIQEADAIGKSDRYEQFAKELAKFNDDLIDMLVDARALSKEDARKILNYYRDDVTGVPYYFPLHRVSDVDNSEFAGTSAGFVNLGKPVRGRSGKGSGRQIVDPLDATVTRAIKFYGRAIQARQSQTLASTLDPKLGGVGGMGGLMDRIPPGRVAYRGKIEEILNTLVSSGTIEADQARAMRIAARIMDPENGPASQSDLEWFADQHQIEDWENNWDQMENAAMDEPDALAVISLWRPDYTPNAQKRTVMIYDQNGNKLMYEMDPDLYDVSTGMQELEFNSFMNILREAARHFKAGAVGLSTGFGTANLLRDYWEFQGKANHVKGLSSLGKPWQMLGSYVAEKTKQSLLGKYVGKKMGVNYKPSSAMVRLYEESGGKLYSVVGHDVDGRAIYRRKKMGKSTMSKLGLSIKRPLDTANNVLGAIQELIAISDAPPRMADAEAALAELGFVAKGDAWVDTATGQTVDALPEHARIAAAVAMSEATINFKRIGTAGQYVEAFFPFFNATLQATYRQYRQMENLKNIGQDTPEGQRAMRTLVYISALAATSAAYWLLRHDDDDYRNQDGWLRDGYWTWGTNGKTYYRVPKPRDFGVVANVTENMLDAWSHKDSRDTVDVITRDLNSRVPTGGGMLRGVVETYVANRDYFRGRELEAAWMQDIPKQYRTNSYTSRMSDYLGEKFGKMLNTSPIQFQHLLNSASGGMYGRFTDTYDAAKDGRLGPEHVPFVRGLMIDRRQTRPVGEFYEQQAEIKRVAAEQNIEKSQVDADIADKLAYFEWVSEVMTALREAESKLGKKRTFENEKYITGLARSALGYDEQESNPNPLTNKNLPDDVEATIKQYRQRVIEGAATRLSPRSAYKSEEAYQEQASKIARAEARLKMLNLTEDEARELLKEYWRAKNGMSIYQSEAGIARLRKLRELFKSK